MKVLVTGFSGRLGRQVAASLLEGGFSVRVLLHTRAIRRSEFHGSLEPIWGHMGDVETIQKAINGVDAVVHSARSSSPGAGAPGGLNEQSTLLLFNHAKESGVRRFAFVSSVVVFGMRRLGDKPISECSPMLSEEEAFFDYPREKVTIEKYLKSQCQNGVMQLGIFRPGPIIDDRNGPGIKLKTVLGRTIALGIGNGRNHMPYIHSADVAEAIRRWLAAGEGSADYNVTPSKCLRRREWAAAWCQANRIDAHLVFLRRPVARSLFLGTAMLRKVMGKKTDRGAKYALITETRDLIYNNDRLKRDLTWTDTATSRYWRLIES